MKKRKCVPALLYIVILMFATSCTQNSETAFEETPPISTSNISNNAEYAHYLKEGDTKTLVGFSFGDIKNDNVEKTGNYAEEVEILRLKDGTKDNLELLFFINDGQFYGMTCSEGDFFGTKVGVDKIEKAQNTFGEHNTYVKIDDNGDGPYYIYTFGKATMYLNVDNRGTIWKIDYVR
jgi:hypothetical protein